MLLFSHDYVDTQFSHCCLVGPDFDYEGDCFDAPTAGVAGSSWPGIAWSNELFGGVNV